MDVHPTNNGINRYWSIPKSLCNPFFVGCLELFFSSKSVAHHFPSGNVSLRVVTLRLHTWDVPLAAATSPHAAAGSLDLGRPGTRRRPRPGDSETGNAGNWVCFSFPSCLFWNNLKFCFVHPLSKWVQYLDGIDQSDGFCENLLIQNLLFHIPRSIQCLITQTDPAISSASCASFSCLSNSSKVWKPQSGWGLYLEGPWWCHFKG